MGVLVCHRVLGCVALLPGEYVLLLRATLPSSVDCHDNLASLLLFLVNCIVPLHLDHLADLNRRVANIAILVALLLKIALVVAATGSMEESC